jgi:hypothetical protein
MPFLNEIIEDSNVQHGTNQLATDVSKSDPTTALYLLLAVFVVYLFRGVIFILTIFIIKLSILGLFGFFTYKMFLT